MADFTELDAAKVKALVESGDALLVDLREQEEWNAERIPGAIHAPMSSFDAAAWTDPSGGKAVLFCLGGKRSEAVAQRLIQAGKSATHMKGGLMAWKQAGFPTEA
ncbi:rhodanese-like domain-containing protein [Telmatospirillum sp. J64-1]|uniref:rhodanese-like domain-containing protein n=1 Tax=Telmatospirillum sp. J64-1 TaxID=2502183 RepID=UPI00115E95DF|nr:rhodanese-like domain-containing protein [Telmatospirillum sp. J64-1]